MNGKHADNVTNIQRNTCRDIAWGTFLGLLLFVCVVAMVLCVAFVMGLPK